MPIINITNSLQAMLFIIHSFKSEFSNKKSEIHYVV
jgi:hypothetical protein